MDSAEIGEFEEFVQACAPSLIRLSYALCGDLGRAQDAAQTAFERMYQRWGKIDDPWAYARRAAVNATHDGWRSFASRVVVGLQDDSKLSCEPIEASDERDEIIRALRILPHAQRAVLVLRYWQDLTEAETAAVLGVSVGTVKTHGHRAMQRLRKILDVQEDVQHKGVRP